MVGQVVMCNVGMSAWPDYTLLFLFKVAVMLNFLNDLYDSGYCIKCINIGTFVKTKNKRTPKRLMFCFCFF